MPERIQLHRYKGWRMPDNTMSVARPTKWGNPCRVGPGVTPLQALAAFAAMEMRLRQKEPEAYARDMAQLRGKNLACWCAPGEPCHAEILLLLANKPES